MLERIAKAEARIDGQTGEEEAHNEELIAYINETFGQYSSLDWLNDARKRFQTLPSKLSKLHCWMPGSEQCGSLISLSILSLMTRLAFAGQKRLDHRGRLAFAGRSLLW